MPERTLSAHYTYSPLQTQGAEAGPLHRLFILHPARYDADLHGELIPFSVSTKYEALSGFWESECSSNNRESSWIYLQENNDSSALKIGSSLAAALRELRKVDLTRTLWIDVICINQSDPLERSQHVPLIGQIYEQAERVCIWLGAGSADEKMAFSHIRELGDLGRLQHLLDPHYARQWTALATLMGKEWFTRQRSVIEMAFSNQAEIYCGNHSIGWTDFVIAAGIFDSVVGEASDLIERYEQKNTRRTFPESSNAISALRFIDILRRVTYKASIDSKTRPSMSLEDLVSTLSGFYSHDPRDVVYAALPLATNARAVPRNEPSNDYSDIKRNTSAKSSSLQPEVRQSHQSDDVKGNQQKLSTFPVDYFKSVYEVYQAFIGFVIRSSNSLDIVCRPWIPDDVLAIRASSGNTRQPSWACLASRSPFLVGADNNHSRANADPLVGVLTSREPIYAASAGTSPDSWFFGGKEQCSLVVSGKLIGEIQMCEAVATAGNIPMSWCEMGDWADAKTGLPPDEFWRTLVADRNERGQNPPSYYSRAFRFAFNQAPGQQALETTRLLEMSKTQTMKDFIRRVQAVTWNRRLVRIGYNESNSYTTLQSHVPQHSGAMSKEPNHIHKGKLGLVPANARVGDKICLLQGCSVPVVVREITTPYMVLKDHENQKDLGLVAGGVSSNTILWPVELIGESYVHGIMNGEALSNRGRQNLPDRMIEIR